MAMTDQEKIKVFLKVQRELRRLNSTSRATMLWGMLRTELAGKEGALTWLIDQVGDFVESEGSRNYLNLQ